MSNKRNHYVKIDPGGKIYNTLLDEVESNDNEGHDNVSLLNNTDTELGKNVENNIVLDKQSNNVLIPEVNIHFVEDVAYEAKDEEIVSSRNRK